MISEALKINSTLTILDLSCEEKSTTNEQERRNEKKNNRIYVRKK